MARPIIGGTNVTNVRFPAQRGVVSWTPRPHHLPGIEASSLPSPRQGRNSSTEVGIPTSLYTEVGIPTSVFCPKIPSPGQRRRCVSDAVLAASLTKCFFSPFTRPAVNPGVGTGLLHSILAWAQDCFTAWAQDCFTQSWRGPRIASVSSRKLWKRVSTQRRTPGLAARIARKTPSASCCVAGR